MMYRLVAPALGAVAGAALALAAHGGRVTQAAPSTSSPRVKIPKAAAHQVLVANESNEPFVVEGELYEAAWTNAPRTHAFVDATGEAARPYSEARVAWHDGTLYLALYAADEMIHRSGPTRDTFRVALGALSFEVGADGRLDGAPPGTRAAVDVDGIPDDDAIDDEEWKVEIAIPMSRLDLAGASTPLVVERCDTPRDGVKRCGAWRGDVVLSSGGNGESP